MILDTDFVLGKLDELEERLAQLEPTLQEVQKLTIRLRQQRDDLLAACEAARDAIQSLEPNALGRDSRLGYPYQDELLVQLDTAIARARGQED